MLPHQLNASEYQPSPRLVLGRAFQSIFDWGAKTSAGATTKSEVILNALQYTENDATLCRTGNAMETKKINEKLNSL